MGSGPQILFPVVLFRAVQRGPQMPWVSSQRPGNPSPVRQQTASLYGRVPNKFIVQTETLLKGKGGQLIICKCPGQTTKHRHPTAWRRYRDVQLGSFKPRMQLGLGFCSELKYPGLSLCKFSFFIARLSQGFVRTQSLFSLILKVDTCCRCGLDVGASLMLSW